MKIGSKEERGTVKIKPPRQNKTATVGDAYATLKCTKQTSSGRNQDNKAKDASAADAPSGSKQTSIGSKAKRKAKEKEMTALQKLLKTSKMAQSSLDQCGTEANVPEMLQEDDIVKHTSTESEAFSPDFGGPSGRKIPTNKGSTAGQPLGKKGANKTHE